MKLKIEKKCYKNTKCQIVTSRLEERQGPMALRAVQNQPKKPQTNKKKQTYSTC